MSKNLYKLEHAVTEVVARPGFRSGLDEPELSEYAAPISLHHPLDLDSVRQVIDEAMLRYQDDSPASDRWLAPRLHYCLRLTRREAADQGFWRWLGASFAADYVRWRWSSVDEDEDSGARAEPAAIDRFVGPPYKHALARLWWMAELFRNGSDYSPAVEALSNQDIPNNLFRMDIAHHRPTVQAAVRVLRGKTGREANALAKAVNSAATTLVIDVIAPDEPLDPDVALRWVQDAGKIDPGLYYEELPSGPDDLRVEDTSVRKIELLLNELLTEARVRGRTGV